jgi:hypothetical protein
MATFQSPFGGVTVEVAEGNEAKYLAAGWPLVGAVAKTVPASAEVYLSQQNKSQLIETASKLGLDDVDSLTRKELVELIELAKSDKK